MSFSRTQTVCCLGDQLHYCMLIEFIKTPAMLKCHKFEDSKSDMIEPMALKRLCVDAYDNKDGQNLNEYYGKSN